jgi:phosphoenolpyruvate carboxylase
VKITVASGKSVTYNKSEQTQGVVDTVRVEWQEKPGTKRVGVTIISDATTPHDMLRAAASYFNPFNPEPSEPN